MVKRVAKKQAAPPLTPRPLAVQSAGVPISREVYGDDEAKALIVAAVGPIYAHAPGGAGSTARRDEAFTEAEALAREFLFRRAVADDSRLANLTKEQQ